MKRILVTGGTVFVSRFAAEYFSSIGYDVYVLNRNTRPQSPGVTLIQADRHKLGSLLHGIHFDAVVDTAYTAEDVNYLLDALDGAGAYVLISSSAVYPHDCPQPFAEDAPVGENKFWGAYGLNKIAAEETLLRRFPGAYIIRPPYLYGPMNNVYREAFAFDCALADRPFYLPGAGTMPLQFLHVRDLCRLIAVLIEKRPSQHLLNAGNPLSVSIREWVSLCYHAAGTEPRFIQVTDGTFQRQYFPFHDYAFQLDVSAQNALLSELVPLDAGLREAFAWYTANREAVNHRPLLDFIDTHFAQEDAHA